MTSTGYSFARRLLGAVSISAAAVLALPAMAAAAPTGLFEGNYTDSSANTISEFSIGSGDVLSATGTVATGAQSWLLTATPNGKYLYGSNNDASSVSQYRISGATLTPLSPAVVTAGKTPEQIAVSPNGKTVYVANESSDGLYIYTVGSGGTLSFSQDVTTDLVDPTGVAISPSGSSAYVASYGGAITEFNRSGSGAVTPKSTPTIATGLSDDINLAITPNGKYLYASGGNSTLIQVYAVGSGGELTAVGAPAAEGKNNYLLTISPNGRNLYAASYTDGGIYQYSIGSGGQLTPLSPAVAPTVGGHPYDQWMTSKGSALYAPDALSPTGDVSQFSVSSTGALTPKSPASVPAGYLADDVMIAPDQGPTAKFSVKAGKAGKATRFNASKSKDSDGKVVRYIWKIGHKTKTTHSPKLSYKFKKAGRYKVTLTVVDDSGCSTSQVYTGQVAYCNGTRAARITHKVKIKKA